MFSSRIAELFIIIEIIKMILLAYKVFLIYHKHREKRWLTAASTANWARPDVPCGRKSPEDRCYNRRSHKSGRRQLRFTRAIIIIFIGVIASK